VQVAALATAAALAASAALTAAAVLAPAAAVASARAARARERARVPWPIDERGAEQNAKSALLCQRALALPFKT
jgi:hypothetical protein